MVTRQELDKKIEESAKKVEASAATPIVKDKKDNKVCNGGCFCRPDMKGHGRLGKTSKKLCSCGYKRRGRNHDNGTQHRHGRK